MLEKWSGDVTLLETKWWELSPCYVCQCMQFSSIIYNALIKSIAPTLLQKRVCVLVVNFRQKNWWEKSCDTLFSLLSSWTKCHKYLVSWIYIWVYSISIILAFCCKAHIFWGASSTFWPRILFSCSVWGHVPKVKPAPHYIVFGRGTKLNLLAWKLNYIVFCVTIRT